MGLLRIVLALSVIAGHADTTLFGLSWVDEFYAVQAFFTISGFYMAMVLNGRYAGLPVSAFYKSRALRIYPGYFAGVLLVLLVSRGDIKATLHGMTPLTQVYFYVQNTIIFGQDLSYIFCMRDVSGDCIQALSTTINPPAWSLAVELSFYVIAPFVVRSPRRIVGLMAVGTVYLLVTNAVKFPVTGVRPLNVTFEYPLRYYFYPSSYIFFGAGALAFHLRGLKIGATYALLLGTVVAFAFIQTVMPPWHLMIFALALPELFDLTRSSRLDRMLGEFSYPLYILHWAMLAFVLKHRQALAPVLAYASVGTVVAVMALCAATVLFFAVDRPMDRIRRPTLDATPAAVRADPAWIRIWMVSCLALPTAVLFAILR